MSQYGNMKLYVMEGQQADVRYENMKLQLTEG